MSAPLSSWSRRRAAVAAEAAAEDAAAREAEQQAERAELEEKPDEEILAELGLPDPDTLVQGDDFKVFMSDVVPQRIRQRALRKLWRSNPVLACVDGLNDYDDDYLTAGLGQGVIKTGYQVGKGMLAHLMEVEKAKADVEDPAEHLPEAEAAQSPEVEAEVETGAASGTPAEWVETEDTQDQEEDFAIAAPRRMQFQFEDDTV